MEFLKGILKVIVSLVFTLLVILPIFLVVFGTNEICRIFAKIIVRLKHGSKVKLVNDGLEGTFGFSSRNFVVQLSVFEKPFDFDNFKHQVVKGLMDLRDGKNNPVYPKFRSIFTTVAGYNCWKLDEDYNVNNHFRHLPEDPDMTEERLTDWTSKWNEEILGKPQWEVIFIPTLPEKSQCGVLFKFHHSYCDGLSLLATIFDRISREKPVPYIIHPITYKAPFWNKFLFNVKGYLLFGWTMLSGIVSTPKPPAARHKCSPTLLHQGRIRINLSLVMSIKNSTRTSLSAVMTYAVVAAYEKVTGQSWQFPTLSIIAKLPYPKSVMVNRIVASTFVVPRANAEDPLARLEGIHKNSSLENNCSMVMNETIARLSGRLPTSIQRTFQIKSVCMLSYLPILRRRVEMCPGARLADIAVWPVSFQNFFVSSLSYADSMTISVQTGGDIMSKDELNQFLEEVPRQLASLR